MTDERDFSPLLVAYRLQVIAAVGRAGGHEVRLPSWAFGVTEDYDYDITLFVDFGDWAVSFPDLMRLASEIGEIVGGASVSIESARPVESERRWREASPL
ncbi:MAG: hypothetical protein H7288_25555 [Kineosporiaceae bacterium]|nr:hypothetical protein [Aeromicrobium sp.]